LLSKKPTISILLYGSQPPRRVPDLHRGGLAIWYTDGVKLTIAQLNPVVGDIEGNQERIVRTLADSSRDGADLVVLPELFLVGYPPKDLVERPWFIGRVVAAVENVRKASEAHPGTGVLFGAPLPNHGEVGKPLYNAALLINGGKILLEQHKSLLPTYDVFDETRYFAPATDIRTLPFKGEMLAISICEDAWNDPELWPNGRLYDTDPIDVLARRGATLFVNISASPFYAGKQEIRFRLIRSHARKHARPFVFVNQVGGNDELVFDGCSLSFDGAGEPTAVGPSFREEVRTIDTSRPGTPGLFTPPAKIEAVHEALVLGLRDYMRKCGFRRALVGLSGGIDSAVTCALAVEAVGSENVLALTMPSPFSSRGSVDDSRDLAARLGIACLTVPITPVYESYLRMLKEHFAGREADVTEENIQARVRGTMLMAFSNKFGYLVLSTGNKSELAVGYCTLYGDMSGGLAILSDVPKTMVYELAAHINGRAAVTGKIGKGAAVGSRAEIIPRAIIDKPPSAELRPDQLDQDTLPLYPILDAILTHYIEELRSVDDIVRLGFDQETTRRVAAMVDRNEYKRKQAAMGLKVTSKAFGGGRRMPVAAKIGF
jgi:NAD+ synthase (glutamine-hydrolysing)